MYILYINLCIGFQDISFIKELKSSFNQYRAFKDEMFVTYNKTPPNSIATSRVLQWTTHLCEYLDLMVVSCLGGEAIIAFSS